ncbi:GA4 desaturase [Hypoxylon rubiginosum]|uniref:GA4 desaturase n=1 Tax=Hypoxylon rubiginosum TaxID=110542 RepID=A0ACB9Z3G2_9PEZI|nr:GA4 desaturase [Hypoxylon rubiginosum]
MTTTTATETKTTPAAAAKSQLEAVFNYYSPPTPPGLNDLSILNGTSPDTVSRQVPVVDLRATAPLSDFTHATHGFQILRQPLPIDASHASVHNPSTLTHQYYPSIIALLKEQLGARSAIVINSTLRDVPAPGLATFDPKNPRPTTGAGSLGPFFIAHSDYTPGAARAHLRAMTPDWFAATGTGDAGTTAPADQELFFRLRGEVIAAEDRAAGLGPENDGNGNGGAGETDGRGGHWDWDGKGYDGPRYAMFSVWRPWETVRRDPLAVLVGGAEADGFPYVPLPRLYGNRPGCVSEYYNENVLVRPPTPEKGHVWGYLSEQRPDEVLALKFYDSEALRRGDGSIRAMCPHSAFHTEDMDDEPVRRSCELRVWCIW